MNPADLKNLPRIPGLEGKDLANYWYGSIDENEAARFGGLSPRTLQRYRMTGGGPKYTRLSSRCVRYTRVALWQWQQGHTHRNTAEYVDSVDANDLRSVTQPSHGEEQT